MQVRRLPPLPADHRSFDGAVAMPEPPTLSRSPNSTCSAFSSSQRSSSSATSRTGAAARSAVRSIFGVFVACFTPPECEFVSEKSGRSTQPKPAPASPNKPATVKNGDGSTHSYSSIHIRKHPGDIKYTIDLIYKATKNFSPSLKIGQGGFGTVYKGTLDDGTTVAIKRARKVACDDHMGDVEFQREIETLTQAGHLNLVQLYGFLEEGDERILVVEYVPVGQIRNRSTQITGGVLDFPMRLDVAIDVAHAITYLHTYAGQPVIHRGIKSSNILLTSKCKAKVADFGFARLAADRDSGDTYLPKLKEPPELITGRRAIEPKRQFKERVTTRWAMKKLMDGDADSILDPRIERNNANTWAIERILQLALKCLAPQRNGRPTMKRCAEILLSIRKEYRDLSVPAHARDSSSLEGQQTRSFQR